MKSEIPKQFTQVHFNSGNTLPKEPVVRNISFTDRRCPDPSSFVRSDRYPNPSLTEFRSRMAQ